MQTKFFFSTFCATEPTRPFSRLWGASGDTVHVGVACRPDNVALTTVYMFRVAGSMSIKSSHWQWILFFCFRKKSKWWIAVGLDCSSTFVSCHCVPVICRTRHASILFLLIVCVLDQLSQSMSQDKQISGNQLLGLICDLLTELRVDTFTGELRSIQGRINVLE